MVSHLISLGHRRIALLTDPAELFTAHERALGYCEAHVLNPVLTVVKQPAYELGSTAARLQRILHPDDTAPQEIVLPTEMVIRTSTAPPASISAPNRTYVTDTRRLFPSQ